MYQIERDELADPLGYSVSVYSELEDAWIPGVVTNSDGDYVSFNVASTKSFQTV